MYQKPDFIKVSIKVSDVFAGYPQTGCAPNEGNVWMYTIPCEGTENYHEEYSTFVGAGQGSACYTSFNP